MTYKLISVFFDKNGNPFKDVARETPCSIINGTFIGASKTTRIYFYYDKLLNEDDDPATWVAVSKLPNGKIGSKVLESYYDDEIEEHYALLELDSFYTQYKGDVYLALQGYQDGVQVLKDDETGIYTIVGTPTIQTTGNIRLNILYAPQFIGSGETQNVNFQQILADLSTKLGIRTQTILVDELPTTGETNVFYVIENDTNNPNKANIYIWNGKTQSYVWVGDNTLFLGDYYTTEQGEDFEDSIKARVTAVENELSSVASGSPAGVYATLSDLTTADPNHNRIYVVTATGNWYYWDGTQWASGGTYQASEITRNNDIVVYLENQDKYNLNILRPLNIFSKKNLSNGVYVNPNNGTYGEHPLYSTSDYTKVNYEDVLQIPQYRTLFGTSVGRLSCYDINKNWIAQLVATEIDENDVATFEINNPNISYIRVTIKDSDIDTFMIYCGNDNYPSTYINFYENIKPNELMEEKILNDIFDFVKGENLFDKNSNDILIKHYVTYSNDEYQDDLYNVANIKIEPYKRYTFKVYPSYFGSNSNYVPMLDANGNYLGHADGINVNGILTIVTNNANAYYIRVNVKITEMDTYMCVEGSSYPSTYKEYINYAKLRNIQTPLFGKKLYCDGDSIMEGVVNGGGFAKIIAENNGMILKNIAVSGGTIRSGTTWSGGGNRHWICESIATLPTDGDYYIFDGGVNDVNSGTAMGSITYGYSGTLDTTTFCGAFEQCCKTLVETFVGKKVGYIFVHRIWQSTDTLANSFFDNAKIILKKWGIPFIDLMELIPSLNLINELKTNYTVGGDGWHPNTEGYNKYYVDKITAWLKTL